MLVVAALPLAGATALIGIPLFVDVGVLLLDLVI
jgi:hypothetical protein